VVQPLRRQGARGTTRPTPLGTAADSLSDGQRAKLIGIACRSPADFGVPHTHWSRKTLGEALARQRDLPHISPRTVGRELNRADLQPHRQRMWLNSHDPRYDEKLADVVALYTDPPRGATVLCFDEKTSIQALERKHPDLPMRPGQPICREFEYVRHGVTHLLGALDVRTGLVFGGFCQQRGRTEFVQFMDLLAAEYPRGPVHLILDNLNTHSGPAVEAWLQRHPRFVFHFTPFHASWLNQIENWFGRLTNKVLRRGSFTSVPDLQAKIRDYIRYHNIHDARAIHWTYQVPPAAEAA
jgi:transposase